MSKVTYITISSDHANRRIDNFLINHLKGAPKSLLYRLMRQGQLRVNKKRVKPDYRLKERDEIRLPPISLEAKESVAKPSDSLIKLLDHSILYENEGFLVINKPFGIAVHGGSGVRCGLIEALRVIRPKDHYLELVHRLDRDTSGCLIIAKKPQILREFHELLREGKIDKRYLALTMGHWPKKINSVSINLEKNQLSSGERKVKASEEGKASLTQFHVLESFSLADYVSVKLYTGRMHQIRAHAQLSGHPVAGDEKYGDRAFNRMMQKSFHLKRLFLHAEKLTFQLPSDQKTINISSSIDEKLNQILSLLRK